MNLQNLEIYILDFIQNNIRNPVLDPILIFITYLGNKGAIWIIISLLLIISKKYRTYGFITLISLILSFLICNFTLKPLISRQRPYTIYEDMLLLISTPKDFSFPSGHTMSSFAATITIFYCNRRFGFFALVLAVLISFSRMYLYVHYPSDILISIPLGILTGYISILVWRKYVIKLYGR